MTVTRMKKGRRATRGGRGDCMFVMKSQAAGARKGLEV